MLGDYTGSLQDFNASLEKEPDNALALSNRAVTKCMLGDYTGSSQDLKAALEKEPSDDFALRIYNITKYVSLYRIIA